MTFRGSLGLLALAGYLAFVAHATARTQCPARELGACARVHALLMRGRAPEPMQMVAAPMSGRTETDRETPALVRLAALPAGR